MVYDELTAQTAAGINGLLHGRNLAGKEQVVFAGAAGTRKDQFDLGRFQNAVRDFHALCNAV